MLPGIYLVQLVGLNIISHLFEKLISKRYFNEIW